MHLVNMVSSWVFCIFNERIIVYNLLYIPYIRVGNCNKYCCIVFLFKILSNCIVVVSYHFLI